jgi:hypothetical protein
MIHTVDEQTRGGMVTTASRPWRRDLEPSALSFASLLDPSRSSICPACGYPSAGMCAACKQITRMSMGA